MVKKKAGGKKLEERGGHQQRAPAKRQGMRGRLSTNLYRKTKFSRNKGGTNVWEKTWIILVYRKN